MWRENKKDGYVGWKYKLHQLTCSLVSLSLTRWNKRWGYALGRELLRRIITQIFFCPPLKSKVIIIQFFGWKYFLYFREIKGKKYGHMCIIYLWYLAVLGKSTLEKVDVFGRFSATRDCVNCALTACCVSYTDMCTAVSSFKTTGNNKTLHVIESKKKINR